MDLLEEMFNIDSRMIQGFLATETGMITLFAHDNI